MPKSSPPPPIDPQEIARLYLAGHVARSIADLLGIKIAVVYSRLEAHGVKRRPRGRPSGSKGPGKLTHEQREQMRADLRSGELPTMAAVAHKYGITREAVRLHARRMGVMDYSLQALREASLAAKEATRRSLAAKRAAHHAKREALRRRATILWKTGMPIAEMAKVLRLVTKHPLTKLIALRRVSHPADFPLRIAPRAAPQELAARARAKQARMAAQAAAKETRLRQLSELWKQHASGREGARVLGRAVETFRVGLSRARRSHPELFPPRGKKPQPR